MTLTATEYKHILLDDNGVPLIAGTTMKVIELVTSHLTYGWSPEELHFQYPHVALGKIYSALAYGVAEYWDEPPSSPTLLPQGEGSRNQSPSPLGRGI